MQVVYRGFITQGRYGDDDEAIFLENPCDRFEREPIAERIRDDRDINGRFLCVRYVISAAEIPDNLITESIVQFITGASNAKYIQHYSELTGYLFTTAELTVGGHDLLQILEGNLGKFCHMEIEYHKAAKQCPSSTN